MSRLVAGNNIAAIALERETDCVAGNEHGIAPNPCNSLGELNLSRIHVHADHVEAKGVRDTKRR